MLTRPLRLAFDLDGTLLDSHGADYEDPDSLLTKTVPHEAACELVRAAHRAGHTISYVTGRCRHVRHVTLLNLELAGLPAGELIMQEKWLGYDHMATYKAGALRGLRADLYIGDHEADANAAALAGIPFHHADHWRNGILPNGIVQPEETTA